jgi:hypothetical protein
MIAFLRSNKVVLFIAGIVLGSIPFLVSIFSGWCGSTIRANDKDTVLPDWHRNITKVVLPQSVELFGKKVPLENWEVRERFEREFYYNYTNPDQIVLGWKRLKRWEPYVDSSLKANGLHPDFKYLMVAESGVRNVLSPGKANGFWQFIAPTAQKYGLRVDEYIDERLNPYRATPVAIGYLKLLKAQFSDDLLVAAAYNMGEFGLADAIANQQEHNYWNLYLFEETMRYPLRIAVIKELMTHGASYGFAFEKLEPYYPLVVRHFQAQGPIPSVAEWARGEGYTYKDVKIFNPWIVNKSLPAGNYDILLPATDKERTTVK